MAVEQVLGVRALEVGALAAMPPLPRDAQPEMVSAIGTLDRELLMVLESGRTLSDEVWQALDARGASP